jgi:hypothetical protein
MKATSRREALERGLRFYFTGVRCKKWFHAKRHGDKRYATTGRCTECAIRAEIARRKKLPARVRSDAAKRQRRYYKKHKAEIAVKNRAYWMSRLICGGEPW